MSGFCLLRKIVAFLLVMAAASGVMLDRATGEERELEFIGPDKDSGTSLAVVVPPHAARAHTALMLPVNHKNQVVGKGDASLQAERVLGNLNRALAVADSGHENIVKITVYAADHESLAAARQRVAHTFPGPTRPAVTWVVNQQPRKDVLVTMDAVATAPLREPGQVSRFVSDQLPTGHETAHVAVIPPGEVFYISGQLEPSEKSLAEGVRRTMAGLHRTVEYLGLTTKDVVQVRAFINPMNEADAAWKEIAATYDQSLAAPVVLTEWQSSLPRPTEIEMIAIKPDPGPTEKEEASRYLTPPWMSASPVFTRVAASRSDAHDGWVYFSGITGDADQLPEKQVAEVFEALKKLCGRTGSDFEHLLKAT